MTDKTHDKSGGAETDVEASPLDVTYEKTRSGKMRKAHVPLEFDFELDGVKYDSLTFRRMKVKDTYSGEEEQDEAKAGLMIYARMAGVSIDVIGEIDGEDLERITEAIIPLMGKSAARLIKEAMEKQSQ